MKETSDMSKACQKAVERVKDIFSTDNQHCAYSILLDEKEKDTASRYNQVKIPRVLPRIQNEISKHKKKNTDESSMSKTHAISFNQTQEKELSASKWGTAAQTTHQCCVSHKHPSMILLESILAKGSELNSERVHAFKLKEHLLASKKLKTLSKENQNGMAFRKGRIEPMPPRTSKKSEEQAIHEHWQDLLQSKEERHFQIGRVIKYLSD